MDEYQKPDNDTMAIIQHYEPNHILSKYNFLRKVFFRIRIEQVELFWGLQNMVRSQVAAISRKNG